MKKIIEKALEEINDSKKRIEESEKEQLKVWSGIKVDCQPLLLHSSMPEEEVKNYGQYTYKEIYCDAMKSFESQIPAMLSAIRGKAQAVPSLRPNKGCGIYASFFGLRQTLYDDKMPWLTDHLSKKEFMEIKADDLSITSEFLDGLEQTKTFEKLLGTTGAKVFPMDLQGPIDLAHLVYGDDFFYCVYDDRSFIEDLLDLCVKAIKEGSDMNLSAIRNNQETVAHYNELVIPKSLGGIKISEDTATLLAPQHIEEFVLPSAKKTIRNSGGGYYHFCGKNNYLLDSIIKAEDIIGINLGNPEMYDMEEVIRKCAEHGKIYYGLVPREKEESWHDYFYRLLFSSKNNGRKHLLLSVKCSPDETDNVIEAWQEANIKTDSIRC